MKAAIVSLMILVISGCTTHLTDISVMSNKNVNLNKVDVDKMPHVKNVTGKDSTFVFLFVPFGYPHIKTALNDALQKGDGDMIVDASLYAKSWWFIIGQKSIEIQGTVVKTRENN